MWLSGGFIAEVALALGVVMLGFHMVMQIVAAVTLITPTAFNKKTGVYCGSIRNSTWTVIRMPALTVESAFPLVPLSCTQ